MEQAKYNWVWPKQKLNLMMTSHHHHHHMVSSTWEEQAFAEDAAGGLGGCIWPPRSYTCTFCRREFRSAQALGGHMNVHRRDRARLKQSDAADTTGGGGALPNPPGAASPEAHHVGGSDSGGSNLLYNRNSGSSDHWIRVSFSTNEIQEQHKNNNVNGLSAAASSRCFRLIPEMKNGDKKDLNALLDLRKNNICLDGAENNLKILDRSNYCTDHEVKLRLVCGITDDDDEEPSIPSCKRRRIESNPAFGLFAKPGSEIQLPISSMDQELDLELRLGDPPKVK